MRRVGIFGWGVVAPKSPDIDAFERNLASGESWLTPFEGFGPANFLVGQPQFDFSAYKGWIDQRFPSARFAQIEKKLGRPVQYAIGAFIQSLAQNPGLEQALQKLGTQAHVYIGTGLGDLATGYNISVQLYRAQRRWNRFWSQPERNAALRAHLETAPTDREQIRDVPPSPEAAAPEERDSAEEVWWQYWAARSDQLAGYLAELREIESLSVEGDVESAKLSVIKEKRQRNAKLQKKFNAPEPPWNEVSANLLWNISNAAASQVSMLGRITGMTFAPVAACSTFGYALRLAHDAIALGHAKAVVVGATDPAPHSLSVGGFYNARVTAADATVSKPLTGLRGTHVSGGAAVWIVGDYEHMTAQGFKPLGMEPLAVGVSADADHIITPSREGPTTCIKDALAQAKITASEVASWDLHATATPGDVLEVETLRGLVPSTVLITARKGTFGHGMGACGGWELTAQYLGYARGKLFPTPLRREEINPSISRVHDRFVCDAPLDAPQGVAGKMSMGVGGINVCVLSRPWR